MNDHIPELAATAAVRPMVTIAFLVLQRFTSTPTLNNNMGIRSLLGVVNKDLHSTVGRP